MTRFAVGHKGRLLAQISTGKDTALSASIFSEGLKVVAGGGDDDLFCSEDSVLGGGGVSIGASCAGVGSKAARLAVANMQTKPSSIK